MSDSRKPILCLDFDGMIHSYTSGWKGANVIPDPPVKGAFEFIERASKHFRIAVFSSRSNQDGGIEAMQDWFTMNTEMGFRDRPAWVDQLEWPTEKPAAFLSIDDRALCFDGMWHQFDPIKLLDFKPWNKREVGATGTFPAGELNADDEGGLKMAVGWDQKDKIVRIEFGKPVAWLGLPRDEALALAAMLTKHATANPDS